MAGSDVVTTSVSSAVMNTPSEARTTVQVLCVSLRLRMAFSCCVPAASVRGPVTTTQQETPFGQRASGSAQRGEPALELGALHVVRAQLDRPSVGARGGLAVAGAPQQLGVRRVQRLVALESRVRE